MHHAHSYWVQTNHTQHPQLQDALPAELLQQAQKEQQQGSKGGHQAATGQTKLLARL
jgi:hypothetical protein